jgi:hypothetical protein
MKVSEFFVFYFRVMEGRKNVDSYTLAPITSSFSWEIGGNHFARHKREKSAENGRTTKTSGMGSGKWI